MDLELDLSSENMASFLELEQEIKEIPLYPEPMVRPSVIVKPSPKPSLGDIMTSWSRTMNSSRSWRNSS